MLKIKILVFCYMQRQVMVHGIPQIRPFIIYRYEVVLISKIYIFIHKDNILQKIK